MKPTLPVIPAQITAKVIMLAQRVGGAHAQLTKGAGPVIAIMPRRSLKVAA